MWCWPHSGPGSLNLGRTFLKGRISTLWVLLQSRAEAACFKCYSLVHLAQFASSLLFLGHTTDVLSIQATDCSWPDVAKERKITCKMGVWCPDLVLIFPQWPSNEDPKQNVRQSWRFHSWKTRFCLLCITRVFTRGFWLFVTFFSPSIGQGAGSQ